MIAPLLFAGGCIAVAAATAAALGAGPWAIVAASGLAAIILALGLGGGDA